MAYATMDDLLQVDPTIAEYGVLDFDVELAKSEAEINRLLKVRWFTPYATTRGRYNLVFDATQLDSTQFTKATVYHCIAEHIMPKLTKFEVEGDVFQVKMKYYSSRFEEEFDLILREGVRYDLDDNGTYEEEEKRPVHGLYLTR